MVMTQRDPGAAPGEEPPALAIAADDWRLHLARVWRRCCPRCGARSLFATRFRLAEECPSCGLRFRREQGAMTGQMYLSAAVTEVVAAALVLAVFFLTDWGVGVSLVFGLPVVILFSYWFLPKATGLWVAVEFLTDIGNREAWVGRSMRQSQDPEAAEPQELP